MLETNTIACSASLSMTKEKFYDTGTLSLTLQANKLECLSQVNLSGLFWYFRVILEPTQAEYLSSAFLWVRLPTRKSCQGKHTKASVRGEEDKSFRHWRSCKYARILVPDKPSLIFVSKTGPCPCGKGRRAFDLISICLKSRSGSNSEAHFTCRVIDNEEKSLITLSSGRLLVHDQEWGRLRLHQRLLLEEAPDRPSGNGTTTEI